jgi:hypothetical protein
MSSTGQALGYVVGAVAGFFTGGTSWVLMGAAIGGAIGAALDPPKGPKIEGPRLSDTQQQTSAYGAQISRIYAHCATFCNIFWIENNALKEVSKTESQSAKGGGGAETTTYSYYGTFAAGICSVPIGESKVLGRIWLRGKLFYDPTDASLGAHFENGTAEDYFTFYSGADDQLPDDRMQAALGIDSTPAYKGLCYIVFKDLPLEDYGNSIVGTQIKIEVLSSATVSTPSRIVHVPEDLFVKWAPGNGPYYPRIDSSIFRCSRGIREIEIAADGTLISDNGGGTSDNFIIGMLGASSVEFELTGLATGDFKIGGSIFLQKTGGTTDEFQGAAVSLDGTRLYVLRYNSSTMYLEIYDDSLSLISSQATTAFSYQTNIQYPYVQGADIVFCVESDSGVMWIVNAYSYVNPVALWQISATGTTSFIEYIDPPTGVAGPHGTRIAMAATDSLMYMATNGGSFSVYSRRVVVTAVNTTLSAIVSDECLSSGLLEASDIDVTELTQEVRGYKVSNTASIRSAIEPLRACWPFDVVPSGYKIKFVPRGGSSVATIDSLELDARDGSSANGVQITHSREMATQLPRRVEITYIDADREYDIGPPGVAERTNTDATNTELIEMPIVLTADEAQGKAQVLLYLRWLERHDLAFILPPTRLNVEVPDVVTITAPDATYLARLVEATTLPDGRIEAKAKLASTTIYTPNAFGQVGADVGQSLVYGGPARVALLDIPCLTSAMDAYGMAVGMTGYYSGWPGGTLIKSDDDWQSWAALEGFPAPGVTIGTATNALASGRTDIKDVTSILSAHLPNTALTSVTELQMWNGSNHFAVGAHGRWEILAAQTIVEQADGSFYLSNLMRGRFGTEWAMSLHEVGDAVVHLDPALLEFVGLPISALGIQKSYRAVSKGELVSSASDVAFTWEGENIKPLAPIHVAGSKSSAGDWSIQWVRRTRTPVEPLSGVNAPLAETSEAYEVEIWSDSSYTTLKRTITGLSTASATYTSAQQATDFSAVQKFIYVKVYQLSSVIGRGYASLATVGPTHLINLKSLIHFDEGGFEYLSYRKLGLHCDGTNGSTTFTDVHGKTVTANGNAQISTAQYPALTGKTSSGYLDGTGDYLTVPDSADWDFGTGDFSVRIRARFSSVTGGRALVSNYLNSTTGWAVEYIATGSTLRFYYAGDANAQFSWTPSTNTWYLIEISRSGTSLRAFVDGSQIGSTVTNSTNITGSTTTLKIGSLEGTADFFNGYFSEVEVVKGFAINTSGYTAPTVPFYDSSAAIIDKAENTVTTTGTAAIVSNSSAFGGYCLQANQASGYVSIPTIDLTADKWTIECFVTADALPSTGNMGIFDYGTSLNGDGGLCVTIRYDGSVQCFFETGVEIHSSGYISAGQRFHLFVQKLESNIYIGNNGIVGSNISASSVTFVGNKGFRIGYANVGSIETKAIKLDEWRVTSNDAKYPTSGAYTIPSTSFPDP